MGCIYTWSRSESPETNTRTTQDISAPDQSWGGCDNPTMNWPYQGHKIWYLVPRTTNCLPALWPDSDNWAHTPGVYSVATKSWWVLHSWLIEDHLWDDPGACIIEFMREAGFYYLIWMARHPTQLFIKSVTNWRHYQVNMSRRTCVVVNQMQSNPIQVHPVAN